MKTFFKTLFKILFGLAAVYAILLAVRSISDKRGDYIEIYNDEDNLEGDFF